MERIVEPLLRWYGENARDLPWRRDREPYHVWLSEIMLQQTRVEAVRGHYLRFLEALPDIASLAACEETRLMKLWEGLGYYRRARALHTAARSVMERHGGVFPDTYADIRALPGVGPYTAGAIASICFGLPCPAIDGNVLRIMARLLNSEANVDLPRTRSAFHEKLTALYPAGAAEADKARCGALSQALMELGACICIPGKPRCALCPIAAYCAAHAAKTQERLPLRTQKKARRMELRSVFLLRAEGGTAIQKRPPGGLLGGLWELPAAQGHLDEAAALEQARRWGLDPLYLEKTLHHRHVFTHIEWHMRCFVIHCAKQGGPFVWAAPEALASRYAIPSAFRSFL